MTLREFELYCLGRSDDQERTVDVAAVHASWIMNVWTKKRIRPTDLYKRKSDDGEEEDFVAQLKEIRQAGKEPTPEDAATALADFEKEMNERAKRARRRAAAREEGLIQ
jgi:hypothetical protein